MNLGSPYSLLVLYNLNVIILYSFATKKLTTIFLLAYVNDIIITGSNEFIVQPVIYKLHSYFALKDLGSLNFFLGIQATPTSSRLFFMQ